MIACVVKAGLKSDILSTVYPQQVSIIFGRARGLVLTEMMKWVF